MNKIKDAAKWLRDIAQEVEDNPSRWTQGQLAKDAKGDRVLTHSKDAVCWCAEGFMWRDNKSECLGLIDGSIWKINDALRSANDFVKWFRSNAESLENL